jgi:hypothetical protein
MSRFSQQSPQWFGFSHGIGRLSQAPKCTTCPQSSLSIFVNIWGTCSTRECPKHQRDLLATLMLSIILLDCIDPHLDFYAPKMTTFTSRAALGKHSSFPIRRQEVHPCFETPTPTQTPLAFQCDEYTGSLVRELNKRNIKVVRRPHVPVIPVVQNDCANTAQTLRECIRGSPSCACANPRAFMPALPTCRMLMIHKPINRLTWLLQCDHISIMDRCEGCSGVPRSDAKACSIFFDTLASPAS